MNKQFEVIRMLETIFVIDSTKKKTAIFKVIKNNQAKLVDSNSLELDKLNDVLVAHGYIMAA